jgi:hypothetical protein
MDLQVSPPVSASLSPLPYLPSLIIESGALSVIAIALSQQNNAVLSSIPKLMASYRLICCPTCKDLVPLMKEINQHIFVSNQRRQRLPSLSRSKNSLDLNRDSVLLASMSTLSQRMGRARNSWLSMLRIAFIANVVRSRLLINLSSGLSLRAEEDLHTQ